MGFFQKLESLYENKESNLISWEELANVNDFGIVDLNKSGTVKAKKIPVHGDYMMLFVCKGEADSKVEFHYHDCKETIIVEEGTININGHEYTKGDKQILYPGKQHKFYFPEDSIIWVQFQNPIRRT